jgi:tetratricopeptide (TPR) repeat protein
LSQILEKIEESINLGKYSEAKNELIDFKKNELDKSNLLDLENLEIYLSIQKIDLENIYEDSRDIYLKSKRAYEENKSVFKEIQLLDAFSNLFRSLFFSRKHSKESKLKEFNEYIPESEKILNATTNEIDIVKRKKIGKLYLNIGFCYFRIVGNFELAEEFYKQAFKYSNKVDDFICASVLNEGLGRISVSKGDLQNGLEYFNTALKIYEEHKYPGIVTCLNRIAVVHIYKGLYDIGLQISKEGLQYAHDFGNQEMIWTINNNIGEIQANRGDLETGLKVFENNLEESKEKGNDMVSMLSLYNLIHFGLYYYPDSSLRAYLQEIEEINIKTGEANPRDVQWAKLSRAIILKKSNRIQDIATAQQIFREIVRSPIVEFENTIHAIRYLCQILLFELKMNQSELILQELIDLIHHMAELAKQQNSSWIIVEAYMLQAKLAQINFNFEEFQLIIGKAEAIALEKGLTNQSEQIDVEKRIFEDQLDQWKMLVNSNAPLLDRITQARLEDYVKVAKDYTKPT